MGDTDMVTTACGSRSSCKVEQVNTVRVTRAMNGFLVEVYGDVYIYSTMIEVSEKLTELMGK